MTRRLQLFMLAAIALLMAAQPLMAGKYAPKRIPVNPGDGENTIFIYRNDHNFEALFDSELDSITFSCFDENFNHYDHPVMQYVYTRDTCFVMPLEVVDSIGLRTPDIIYKKGVIDLDDEISSRYVVAFDSISVTFAYDTPAMFMPEPGNVLYCPVPNEIFVNPLAARVDEVVDCGYGVRCLLDYCISPGDIFDQYISAGRMEVEQDPDGSTRITSRSSMNRALSAEELRQFLRNFAKDINIELSLTGAPWSDTGLKAAFVIAKGNEDDNNLYGAFNTYVRLLLKHEAKIDKKDNLDRLTAGIFIGTGIDIHAQLSGGKKFVDPDDYNPPLWVSNMARIPIAGTPFFIMFNPFRPLVEFSGGIDANLTLSGEVGYKWVWLLDWDKKLTEFASFEKDRSGFEKNWEGSFTVTGKTELFAGIAPKITLSIFADNVCSLAWEGQLGVVAKATITADAKELARTSKLSEWTYDKRDAVTNHYRNVLSNADMAGIKFGPRMKQGITIEVLKGLFDNINLLEGAENDPDRTSQIPVIGPLLPDKPLSFRAPWTPEFSEIKMERLIPSHDIAHIYRVTYGLKSRSLAPHTLGLVVCDVEKNEATLYRSSEPDMASIKPIIDYSDRTVPFKVELTSARHYVMYPVCIGTSDQDITWGYPYIDFYASPDVVTGTSTNITSNSCRIDKNRIIGYDSSNKVIGIAYVDAGTMNTNEPSQVDFNKIDPQKINVVMLSEDERFNYWCGLRPEFSVTIPGLQDGCKYFYTAFYSSLTEDEFRSNPRIDQYGETACFTAPGDGISVFNIDKRDVHPTMIFAYGCIEWNPKGSVVKSAMNVSLAYRRLGTSEWIKATIPADNQNIKNGVIFKSVIDNLIEDTKYEYKWQVEYLGNVYESAVLQVLTEATDMDNIDPLNLIPTLEAQFVSCTSTTATFRVRADWTRPELLPTYATIGIAYARRKVKYGAPPEDQLAFDNAGHNKTWVDDKGSRISYTKMRGDWVYITISGLKPEDPNYAYYYRPYILLHNQVVQIVRDNLDAFDFTGYWDLPDGMSFKIKYGPMAQFTTRGKNYVESEINHNETSAAKCSQGLIYWGLQNTGVARAKNVGVLLSPQRSSVNNCDHTLFIRGKISTNIPQSAARLKALNADHRRKMQALNGVPAHAEEEDDEEMPVFDVLMELSDYSKLSVGETYYMRAIFQSVDDQYYFSDITEFLYDEDGDPGHNPEDVTGDVTIEDKPGYPVDLGLPSGLLWSTTNIGASEIYEYGDYYAWGETKDKASYTAETYDFPYEKDYLKAHSICAGPHDVASVKWGGDWRLPTEADFQELIDKCQWTWAKMHEVTGYLVTGPNGNSIFLPTAGNMYDDKVYSNGTGGCYWTGTCHEFKKDESDPNSYKDDMSDEEYQSLMEKREAVRFHFHAGSYGNYDGNCYFGRSVRPVTPAPAH